MSTRTPPYYSVFIILNNSMPIGGNCSCAAGASQSYVHISALLITLAEVTPTACISIRCAWSRPSTNSKASLAKELDFRSASSNGYFPYKGPKLDTDNLLGQLDAAGCKPAIADFIKDEMERKSVSVAQVDDADDLLQDPLDKLAAVDNPTVTNLIKALSELLKKQISFKS